MAATSASSRSSAPGTHAQPPPAWKVWTQAARPKTLGAAVAPVVVGAAMAVEAGAFHAPAAGCALLGAMLIQVGTNFSNDYLDFVKGADRESREGPTRATQAGWVSVAAMRRATILAFAAAFASGLYLVWRGGMPILAIGLASIASGVWYTAGRWSLAYLGLADVFVLVFFGPVAVGGTYYVQALGVSAPVLVAGLAPGLLATAILVVNNLRDRVEDARAGKNTLVVRFGRGFGRAFYGACLAGAVLVPPALVAWTGGHAGALLASVAAIAAGGPLARRLWHARTPATYRPLLGRTAQVLLVYSLAFAVGWNL